MSKPDEFDDFMKKVEEVGLIVQDLVTANDSEKAEKAIERADQFLSRGKDDKLGAGDAHKRGFDKTVLNRNILKDDAQSLNHPSQMSPSEFMEEVERDAAARSAKKKLI